MKYLEPGERLLEIFCIVLVCVAFLNTAITNSLSENLERELQQNRQIVHELGEKLEKSTNRHENQQTKIRSLETQLASEQKTISSLKELLVEKESRTSKNIPVVVHDDETSYQVWSLNKEIRRQAAKDKWR